MPLTMFPIKGRPDTSQWGLVARAIAVTRWACSRSPTDRLAGKCASNLIWHQCTDLTFTNSTTARTLELWSTTKATLSSLWPNHHLKNLTKRKSSATLDFWRTKGKISYFNLGSAYPRKAKCFDDLRTLMPTRPFRQKDSLASSSSLAAAKKNKKVRNS